MATQSNLEKTDVVLLCGGLGTRLQSLIKNKPKVLAPINNKPFLNILLEELISFGFKRFILCIGYLKEQFKTHNFPGNIEIIFSEEQTPLGTGGAVKNAQYKIISNPFIVLNGDSICHLNYSDFLEFHEEKKSFFSIALSLPKNRTDGGNVLINKKQKIVEYREKDFLKVKGLINAGIYLMNQEIFQLMPVSESFSLEYDVFPQLIEKKSFGFLTESDVIDIGTVERYTNAFKLL